MRQSTSMIQWLPLRYDQKSVWTRLSEPGAWFNIKMAYYQYRKPHCGDKTVLRSPYLHNGIPYTGKMTMHYTDPQLSTEYDISFMYILHEVLITSSHVIDKLSK